MPNQILGRVQTIGCIAVEITQKCNLDCTLCYLSENSQAVADIPLEEVYRRLDDVLSHYGAGTHVQITGGDPTLRKHTELIDIVRYANDLGLYPALFTNGIAASRKLLTALAAVGLRDVAFHVDTTQRRAEGTSETALNDLRQEYLQRTQGLGLMVIFNTTVHKDNFHELPDLIRFFRQHSSEIGLVSFQLQADTGRGEWRERDVVINQDTVRRQIESGANVDTVINHSSDSSDNTQCLPWEAIQVGHTECHNYLPTLVVNGNIYPVVLDAQFFADFMRDFSTISWDRQQSSAYLTRRFLGQLLRTPRWWWRATKHAATLVSMMWRDVLKARGKVDKMTFFVQNFMDASQLQQERIDACSFMVMTAAGPVSMCQHNASRDDYILRPLDIKRADGSSLHYQPLKQPSASQQKLSAITVQTSSSMVE